MTTERDSDRPKRGSDRHQRRTGRHQHRTDRWQRQTDRKRKGSQGSRARRGRARRFFKGIPVVAGIAIGRVHLKFRRTQVLSDRTLERSEVAGELGRLKEAVRAAKEQLLLARRKVANEIGEVEAMIFDAHVGILEDKVFLEKVRQTVEGELRPVEVVVSELVEGYYRTMSLVDDENLRERALDIHDVGVRLLDNLHRFHTGGKAEEPAWQDELKGDVLFARELLPSDVSMLETASVTGVVTEAGNGRGHCAVLLRALGIPCVMGVEGIAENLHDGDMVIVDGSAGSVFVNPRKHVVDSYRQAEREYLAYRRALDREREHVTRTKDGHRVLVLSNIGHLSEVALAKTQNTDGIGLLRTEIDMMLRDDFPSEDEQYHFFKDLVQEMGDRPTTIRTMDLGYDKQVPYFQFPAEANGALGKRSFRLALELEHYQVIQIKAIMRAAVYGMVKLLFPFITSIEDIRAAKRLIRTARRQLVEEKRRFDDKLPIGMMIEVPAAGFHMDRFAGEVQFFSIGTNDLVQYLCAADRDNPDMAPWYRGYNPGVLRFLDHIIRTARDLDRPVSLCGEMAGDPLYTLFLVGCGVTEFSMSNPQVPLIKKIIRSATLDQAKRIQARALEMTTCRQIHDLFAREAQELLGGDIAYWTSKMS